MRIQFLHYIFNGQYVPWNIASKLDNIIMGYKIKHQRAKSKGPVFPEKWDLNDKILSYNAKDLEEVNMHEVAQKNKWKCDIK